MHTFTRRVLNNRNSAVEIELDERNVLVAYLKFGCVVEEFVGRSNQPVRCPTHFYISLMGAICSPREYV